MKRHSTFKSLFAVLFTLTISSTQVLAANQDYEEVSYDQLLDQLSQKKKQVYHNANDPFDSIMIHAGFGLIGGVNNISDGYKYQNGFQLSVGIDLFSPLWATEGVIRNFGTAKSGTESRTIKEFDLKVLHKQKISGQIGYRVGGGLGTRYLKINDDANGVYINDSTPTMLLFGGIDGYVSKNFSLGLELGARNAMVSNTADKNSMDATVRMDTYF